ncbi:MAG: PQQ-binding-like beta-propeller repeat protein [Planctomycetes bacterium]|nr:PQQ-binding-like beta-propeller repeat protein [Planctomycetota bacterium]
MVLLLSLVSFMATNGPAPARNTWPGFRGRGDCVSAAKDLPVRWSPTENIAWKIDLPGYGQSSPVVWKDKVFVTAVDGANREKGFVLAYDAKSGKKLWSHEFEPTQKAKWSFTVSKAAPTPVVDGDAVLAFFEGGDLLALSHEGKKLWSRSLVKEYGEFQGNHGLGSSPAQTDDAVIILIDHSGPSYLLAVDKKTGKNRWKTERASRGSWASPVIAQRDGKPEIVVSSNGTVAGYDARVGKLLWELDGLSGNTIPSASASGSLLVVGSGIGRKGADANLSAKSNCCLKLVEKNGKPGYEVCWSAAKATCSYATPLCYRGHAYFVNQSGVVYCIDLATGKESYAERIDGPCWASPIGASEHVYFFGKDGQTTVLKAGPTFKKIASNHLWNGAKKTPPESQNGKEEPQRTIVYGVAAVDGAFFIRTGTALYRIGKLLAE